MRSRVWRWLRTVIWDTPTEEAQRVEPRTESERAVKAPLDEVHRLTEDESGSEEEP